MPAPHVIPTLSDLQSAKRKFAPKAQQNDTPFDAETYAIIGAAIEVQKVLGQGFSELVYHDALCREFELRGIPYESEKEITVIYKNEPLERTYRADIICYDDIIVELKMVKTLLPEHTAQVLNYLKATKKQLGILINFGQSPLERKIIPNHITR